tara:strand:+ start:620 stop:1234 length:615 start_codon:yes stop_codon:yes gene_type:complete
VSWTGKDVLSILICSIPERIEMLNNLLLKLSDQKGYIVETHPALGKFEILLDSSKRFTDGGLNIGAKRQALLDRSIGDYVCFLDDDEDISPDYLETILRLCYERKDVGTFRSLAKLSNSWALVDMRLRNPQQQINPDKITYRPPWHVCPVRLDYAKKFKFPDSNYGEDWQWFKQVLKLCKTEAHTDRIIHQYTHGAHSEADKIK